MTRAMLAGLFVIAACSTPPSGATDASADASDETTEGGDAASSDTWVSYAQGFFATYCTECHGAGNTTRDYTTITDVQRDKDLIRCGVASTTLSGCGSFPPPKQFPISNSSSTNPKPSDAERARLVQWIEAGLP